MTPQGTDPDLTVSVKESPEEAWVSGGLLQGWGTKCSSACEVSPFEREQYSFSPRHRTPFARSFFGQTGGNRAHTDVCVVHVVAVERAVRIDAASIVLIVAGRPEPPPIQYRPRISILFGC